MPTHAVAVNESNEVVYPANSMLVQTFTAATKAATAPRSATQFGFETDTGTFYKATGTSAGNWSAIAGGLVTALSGDGSYVGFYNGAGEYLGKVALSTGAL